MAKKVWNFLRVMFLMLKKGISKAKLLADLNTIIKRGKSLHNLPSFPVRPDEYEFSCTDTPPYPLSLFKKHHRHHMITHDALSPPLDISNDMLINVSVMKALEDMLTSSNNSASPVFGKQLKITDSPFMLSNGDDDDQDGEVDEAADKFIMRFYNDLRREN